MGDEGSGAYIGKKFLSDYFYELVPEHIAHLFQEEKNITIELALNNIYKQPNANAYLASFCKWLVNHKKDSYVHQLIKNAFTDFVVKQIQPYGKSTTNKVFSIGSIAYYFSDIWELVLNENGYVVELSEQDPILGLINYHANGETN